MSLKSVAVLNSWAQMTLKLTLTLALLALVGCAGSRPQCDRDLSSLTPPSREQQKNADSKPPVVLNSGSETAGYSYATGCFQAYERICGKLLTDSQRDVCREDGLSVCEKYAHDFGEWIRSGSSSRPGSRPSSR